MSLISYTYEIIKVDPQARVMEVVYSSPGRQTMHVGARLPYVGESLEAVIDMYSPVAYWREQEAEVVVPALGSGQSPFQPAPVTLESAKTSKLIELADARWRFETSGVVLNGVRIKTDRESQATLSGAYVTLKDGLATSIDWKADGGVWTQLTLAQITPIAQAVAAHVQGAFSMERQLSEQVAAATTIEQVQAITWPN